MTELILRGCRLTLTPFLPEQVHDRYLSWLSDPEVNRYSQRRNAGTVSAQSAQDYLSSLKTDEAVLAVHCPEHGHVGNVKYGPIDRLNRRADISILMGERQVWGRGYGTEAIYLVSRHLFETENLNRVDAGSTNPAFLRAVAKLGWRTEGVLRQRVWLGDHFVDWTLVAQLQSEFTRRPEWELA